MFYITPSITINECSRNVTCSNYMGFEIELAALQSLLQGPTPAGHVLHFKDSEKTALM